MKECVICGTLIRKKDSVMSTEYVCSIACKSARKQTLPPKLSILSVAYWTNQGYTEADAKIKISELQASRSPMNVSYWINQGLTEDEAKAKVSEVQQGNSNQRTEKYTHEELQAFTPFSPVYWVNKGYTEEEASDIISQNNNNVSLEAFVKRYGVTVGTEKYNLLCDSRKESYTLSGYIERHGESDGAELWNRKYAAMKKSEPISENDT